MLGRRGVRRFGSFLAAVLVAAGLVLVPQVQRAVAGTTVSSDITSDAVWDVAGSPYVVVGDRKVQPGARLTIRPGVQVEMGTGSSQGALSVWGTLIANGSAASPITFTKMVGGTNVLSFDKGFTGPLPGMSLLNHVVVQGGFAGTGPRCNYNALGVAGSGRVQIFNSVFQNNVYGALGMGSAESKVANSTFTNNGCDADFSAGEFRGNLFGAANVGSGPDPSQIALRSLGANKVVFVGNRVQGKPWFAVNSADQPAFMARDNWFETDTYRNTDSEVPKHLENNWWGSAPDTLNAVGTCWATGVTYIPAVKTTSDVACPVGGRITSYLNPTYTTVLPANAPPALWPPAAVEPATSEVATLIGSRRAEGKAEDPVDALSGNLVHDEALLSSPPGVFGLDFGLTYNSRGAGDGSLSAGWQGSFSQSVTLDGSGDARVTLSDGRVVRYTGLGASGFRRPDVPADLVRNGDGTWTMRWFHSGVSWTFDTAGRVSSMLNWDGQSVGITRNGSGWPVSVTASPVSASLAFSYGGPGGALSSVTASDGRAVSLGYTGGFVSSITRPGSRTTVFGLDGSGRVTQITDPSGVVTMACTFDGSGRVVTQTRGVGGTTASFAYDNDALTATVTDGASGQAVSYVHDALGRLAKLVDPSGKASQFTYDGVGNTTVVIDRRGKWWSQSFDAHDNPVSSTDPTNVTVSVAYDGLDRPVSVSDPAVGTVTYTYSGTNRVPSTITDAQSHTTSLAIAAGLVTGLTDPDGVVTTYGYDAARRLTSVTTAAGTTTIGYDGHGNPTSSQSPLGLVSSATYDAADRLVSLTDPTTATTNYTWNGADQLTAVTDPAGAVWASGFDSSGRWASATNPLGNVSSFGFDTGGRVTSETPPGGGVSRTVTWGPLGRLATVKDELNRQTSLAYDDNGNLATVTDPLNGSWAQTFDNAGRVRTQRDANFRTTTSNYDSAGRVSSVVDPAGRTVSYGYDSVGRVATMTNSRGGVSAYTYTAAGRLATVTAPSGGVTTYGYDSAGRVATITDALGHATTYGYDADGRQTAETSPLGLVTTIGYDAAGRVTSVTDPAGVVRSRTYTTRGLVATEAVAGVTQASYSYDLAGKLIAAADANGNQTTFGYDARGRNTALTAPGGAGSGTGFDAASQLTSRTDPLTRTTTYTYDANGRLKTFADPSGKSATINYNASGDPTSYTYGDGSSVSFAYASDGRRTSMTDSTGTTTFGYDASKTLVQIDAPRGRVTTYGYDTAGRRTSMRTPSGAGVTYSYDAADRVVSLTATETMADFFTAPANAAPDPNRWTLSTNAASAYHQDGASWSELRMQVNTPGASANATISANVAASADQDLVFMYHPVTGSTVGTLRARLRTGVSGAGSGYWLEMPTNSTTGSLVRSDGTTQAVLATFTVSTATSPIWLYRFRLQGATLSYKRWQWGTTEPGSWTGQVNDPNPLTGTGGMQFDWSSTSGSANQAIVLDNVTYTDLTNPPGAVLVNTYDIDDNLTAQTTPSGARTFTYTNDRLAGYTQTIAGTTVETATLAYDAAGRISGDGANTYTYDPAGQLLSATLAGTTTSYGYDTRGRRTTAGATTYSYDAAAQLTSSVTGGVTSTYSYDGAGRRVSQTGPSGARTYAYNAAGRLTSAVTPAGTFTRTYDADGYLSLSGGPAGAWQYDWDRVGHGVPQLTRWAGPAAQSDFAGTDSIDVARQGPVTHPTRQDLYGSIRSTAGVTGAMPTDIATSSGYSPWGAPTGATGITPSLGYRAALNVGDGLWHLHNRTYDPTSGAFLTVDPAEADPGTATFTNPYAYTDNTPTNAYDPLGLKGWKIPGAGTFRSAVHYATNGIDGFNSVAGRVLDRVEGIPRALADTGISGLRLAKNGAVQWVTCPRCAVQDLRIVPYWMHQQSLAYGTGPLAWLSYASHLANPFQGAVDSAAGLAGCLEGPATAKCLGDTIFNIGSTFVLLRTLQTQVAATAARTITTADNPSLAARFWNRVEHGSERGAANLPGRTRQTPGPEHGPPKPTFAAPEIAAQKLAGHVPGTPQYANRVKQGTPTSAFSAVENADSLSQYAWEHGTPVPGRPNVRDFDFGRSIGTSPTGSPQSVVRVHMDSVGRIHGHPKG